MFMIFSVICYSINDDNHLDPLTSYLSDTYGFEEIPHSLQNNLEYELKAFIKEVVEKYKMKLTKEKISKKSMRKLNRFESYNNKLKILAKTYEHLDNVFIKPKEKSEKNGIEKMYTNGMRHSKNRLRSKKRHIT